jgi:N-glycosylase/DNA lyase
MEIREAASGILLRDVENFDPVKIFECGQAFRWIKGKEGYTGVVSGKVLKLKSKDGGYELQNTCMDEFNTIWKRYFDLEREYDRINIELSKDEAIKEAIDFGSGIRILNQDFWETLISFIISANNNIPRIKGIIERLSLKYGKRIKTHEGEHYAFPTPIDLASAAEEELLRCGCGYRACYIKETAKMVESGEVSFKRLKDMSYMEALRLLLKCPGVGNKVADCVLLFSAGKTEAFPIDVWIKRAMGRLYGLDGKNEAEIRRFAQERFGSLAGFAQQYLFYREISKFQIRPIDRTVPNI